MDTHELKSRADFLASVDLLSALTRKEIERLAEAAQSRLLAFGDTVCSAGEAAEGLFVVKSGSVRVFAEEGGKEVSLGVRKAGDVFAEMVMLREYRHEASVRASAKTELLIIPRAVIAPMIAANPAARAFVASRVAIGSAGGLISQLFDLRGKVDKGELEEIIRSVGVKQVGAGKEIVEAGLARRPPPVRGAPRRGAHRAPRGRQRLPAGHAAPGRHLRREGLPDAPGADAAAVAATETALLVIPEKTVAFILERNPKLREALEERIRALDRELLRQKKLAERRKLPLMLDLKSKPELGEKVIQRFAWIQQAEQMDCGAACLAMICKHYGIDMTLGKLREMANVTTRARRWKAWRAPASRSASRRAA